MRDLVVELISGCHYKNWLSVTLHETATYDWHRTLWLYWHCDNTDTVTQILTLTQGWQWDTSVTYSNTGLCHSTCTLTQNCKQRDCYPYSYPDTMLALWLLVCSVWIPGLVSGSHCMAILEMDADIDTIQDAITKLGVRVIKTHLESREIYIEADNADQEQQVWRHTGSAREGTGRSCVCVWPGGVWGRGGGGGAPPKGKAWPWLPPTQQRSACQAWVQFLFLLF